jgi:hypothetical protein
MQPLKEDAFDICYDRHLPTQRMQPERHIVMPFLAAPPDFIAIDQADPLHY